MKIAILGTGIMGSGLAEGMIKAGYETIVYNRTISKTEALVALGAKAVQTPHEAIELADVSILVLSDAQGVKNVLLNEKTRAVLEGKKILNAATTSPFEIIEIANEVANLGGDLSEMSILSGADQLRNHEGAFLLGCDESVSSLWSEVLNSVGPVVQRVGVVGDASKAEVPMLIGSMFMSATVAYSAAMAMKLNVPQEIVTQQVSMFVPHAEYFLPNIYSRDYSQTMASVNSFLDVSTTAISTAKSLGMPTEALDALLNLFEAANQRGYGEQDGSSIVEVLLNETK